MSAAIGSDNIGETVEGLQDFPINLRFPRETCDSLEGLHNLLVITERGARICLGDVATPTISNGPPMLRRENARLSGWLYVDVRDLKSTLQDMQRTAAPTWSASC